MELDPRSREYDVVMHLLGEQLVFFGMRQFRAEKNILTTAEYEPVAERLAKTAGIELAPVIIPDPFKACGDPEGDQRAG